MLGRTAPMHGGPAESSPQAPDRLPRDGQAMVFAQLLAEVGVIEARVAVLQQRLDLRAYGRGQPPVGGPPPPLVAHRLGAPTRNRAVRR
jgi:hypothetical protein